jgi:secretion/DNA translocation related TadE-like protein
VDRDQRDQGSGTVWVVVLLALLLAVGSTGLGVASAVLARQRAAAAADLAALAAATAAGRGQPAPCGEAGRVAERNGAVVTTCRISGAVADVAVRLPVRGPLAFRLAAHGYARAGPAEAPGR